ncbi:heparinase II/III family protein [bacterium]|nr:heparinase II/III family protein [bacterium]
MNPLTKVIKSIRQLGFAKVWQYAVYQIGLRTGHYQRLMPSRRSNYQGSPSIPPLSHFPEVYPYEKARTLAAADEIRQGKVRLFGSDPVPLSLEVGASQRHWSILALEPYNGDIKWIWEPGRLGWAITLARAYAFNGDPADARDFWEKVLHFLEAHPPNLGRQWQSAQEVAIRLMVLVLCDRTLAGSSESTPERRLRLWQAVAEHAERIPPTLNYARAQNNNHLLSEAAGLYTAGLYLSDHPKAKAWRELGWRWLNWGFQNQIDESGRYVQYSANYHRLMLQLALFTDWIRRDAGEPDWPEATRLRLGAATRWLGALTDPETGAAPNLGANDGAYIFPLTNQAFCDFRPVVSAAGKAFLGLDIYRNTSLGEMAAGLGMKNIERADSQQPQAHDLLRMDRENGRAFLRAVHFDDRPSHADQLHLDLWWRGENVARDPGTYLYNAPPPWDNALATAMVHNTLTLDGVDQMQRAGRFLWLDWAQAEILAHEVDESGRLIRLTGEHDGYRHLGALHRRTVEKTDSGWRVTDQVLKADEEHDGETHQAQVRWLLPDWELSQPEIGRLRTMGPDFGFELRFEGVADLAVIRAGECLLGEVEAEPTWGWYSPTYGVREPALMVIVGTSGELPLQVVTEWVFD